MDIKCDSSYIVACVLTKSKKVPITVLVVINLGEFRDIHFLTSHICVIFNYLVVFPLLKNQLFLYYSKNTKHIKIFYIKNAVL